jgi:hypothetical protein
VSMSQWISDLKDHLEHGARLAETHAGPLAEQAARLESDPVIAAAEAASLPEPYASLAADLITKLGVLAQESESAKAAAAAAQAAAEAAAAPPAPEEPQEPAEAV